MLAFLESAGLVKQCGCAPNPWSYSECAGFATLETDPTDAYNYADRVGAPKNVTDTSNVCSVRSLCVACIMCHRMPYFDAKPGDCQNNLTLTGGSPGTALSAMASQAIGGSIGIGSILTIPFAITAAHTQAELLEIKVLCNATGTYNQEAGQIEAALSTGRITLQQAIQFQNQLAATIIGALASGLNTCNARCYYTYATKALTLWCNEIYYPRLAAAYNAATTPAAIFVPTPAPNVPAPPTGVATIPAVAYSPGTVYPTASVPVGGAPSGFPDTGGGLGLLKLLGLAVAGFGFFTGHLILAAAGAGAFLLGGNQNG